MRPVTPSQTIGPFWHPLADPALADLTRSCAPGTPGEVVTLTGRVVDGDGALVTDACIEIWQATPSAPGFAGWGRCATDLHGEFRFVTLAPDPAAPYLAVAILARGLVKPLWTRVYVADVAGLAGLADPLLASLPAPRRATLLARPDGAAWRWDVRLQANPGDADAETVFLAF
jgi:protocatechuate 3,4-dioxygenase alpha subunit